MRTRIVILVSLLIWVFSSVALAGNSRPHKGPMKYGAITSKAMMKIFFHSKSFYCGCKFNPDKTVNFGACYQPIIKFKERTRIEQEHIMPISWFGRTRSCWHKPKKCRKSNWKYMNNRACCRKIDPVFAKAEADLHNLRPVIGQLNAIRSNKPYGEISGEDRRIGGCNFESTMDVVEPDDHIKDNVARIFLYMAETWGVFFTSEEITILRKWSKLESPTEEEKEINKSICLVQGNGNPYIEILKTNCEPAN